MKNVVGLSGAHGTGKSTIISGIKSHSYLVSDISLSRTAQKKMGKNKLYTIKSLEEAWLFQREIANTMFDRDSNINRGNEIVTVDRTPADVWAGICMWYRNFNQPICLETDVRLKSFYDELKSNMEVHYALAVYVPIMDIIEFVSEPNRASEETREEWAKDSKDFIESCKVSKYIIKSSDKETRLSEVISQILILRWSR